MQEDKAGKILREKFPFGVLSNVPLFRSDTPEEHLYANQADHLLHLRKGDHEKLIIVECKENVLRRWSTEKSRPIVDSSKFWFALYFGKAKDSKKQVRNQARALYQNLNLQFCDGPRIEGWVVHSGRHPKEIKQHYDDGVLLIAMTGNLFRKKLKRMKQQGWKAVSVYSSEYLSRLHLGRREENFPHPIIIDALDHVKNSRLTLDGGIFTKLRLGQKRSHWAISGAAGSGKSVLLAYSICVFATDYWIQRAPGGSLLKMLESVGDKLPAAMPPLNGRRIYAFAMSSAQVEALERYFERFRSEFYLLNGAMPALAPITFAQWTGEIPEDCTVLAIDEAQDLTLEDQAKIAQWHGNSPDNYLVVALDHQQRLRQDRHKPKIIEGLNFSRKTTTMTRSYRQTYPAAITGLALLFRWFSEQGLMICPDAEEVPTHSELNRSLRGCLGAKVTTNLKSQQCVVTMRNDSHPGNHWRRTVDLFERGNDVLRMLENQRVRHQEVLWLRFDGAETSDQVPDSGVEFYDVSSGSLEGFVNRRIKGLEHPIVVIEGMPEDIDDIENPERMWIARRLLYLCTSRASGFLYFVIPRNQHRGGVRDEISRILNQLSNPEMQGHEIGETWKLSFKWRPNDVIEVPDFEDAVPDPEEIAAEKKEGLPEPEEASDEDLEEIVNEEELAPEPEIPDAEIVLEETTQEVD